MGVAAALFPVKDGFIKSLYGSVSGIEAGLIYFSVQAAIAFFWLRFQQEQNRKISQPLKLSPLLVSRSAFQVLAIILFFYSIQHAPLAEAVILFSSNALFVILFSFLFFRVKTKSNVIMTALFGFSGVIIVLGPSVWELGDFYLLFALSSAISFSVYLILTGKLGVIYPPNQMLLVDGVSGVCLILFCMLVFKDLNSDITHYFYLSGYGWLYLITSGVVGTCSSLLVISAMKLAPAPLIAPLGYIEIVSAAIIGVFIFNESIHTSTVVGCLIILASSWYSGRLASKFGA